MRAVNTDAPTRLRAMHGDALTGAGPARGDCRPATAAWAAGLAEASAARGNTGRLRHYRRRHTAGAVTLYRDSRRCASRRQRTRKPALSRPGQLMRQRIAGQRMSNGQQCGWLWAAAPRRIGGDAGAADETPWGERPGAGSQRRSVRRAAMPMPGACRQLCGLCREHPGATSGRARITRDGVIALR